MHDASALQTLVLLGVSVLALTLIAHKIRVAPPIVLLIGGVALAFVPWQADVRLRPEVVLLIFLPALLFWESLNTSLREIQANLRAVMIDSVLLVLATAGAVAAVAHMAGLSWPVAWVLGAVVAPTDATAVGAVAGRMPRRQVTILRAESLINDGTALVVYSIAVDVASGRVQFGWPGAIGRFVLSYVVGAAVGLVVAWLADRARRVIRDPLLQNTVGVLTPFTAFLIAEQAHASGVLAVVVAGLALSQTGPRIIAGLTRMRSRAFWQLATFLLNGTLFVLVGLQLRSAVDNLFSYSIRSGAVIALLVSATVIGTRLLWMYTVPYLIRPLDLRPDQRERRLSARERFPIAWAGFRGGVSLAAALAVPQTMADGSRFPGRDLIIVVTFGVILVTLLVQGLSLPAVLRWARLPDDDSERVELNLGERTSAEAALAALPRLASELNISREVVDRMQGDLEERLAEIAEAADDDEDDSEGGDGEDTAPDSSVRSTREQYRRLHSAIIGEKRKALVALRDAKHIDDIVLRRIQGRLDAEEVRLSATPDPGAE